MFVNLAGGKRREQSNLLFDFLESLSTILGQSINLDTTASGEDPMYTLNKITENPSYHTISVKEFGSRSNMTLFACPDPENFVRVSQTFTHNFYLMRGETIQIQL